MKTTCGYLVGFALVDWAAAFSASSYSSSTEYRWHSRFRATLDDTTDTTVKEAAEILGSRVLQDWRQGISSACEYADMFGLPTDGVEASLYGLFRAIVTSQVPLGLKGQPWLLRSQALPQEVASLEGFFTMKDLAKALDDDFLDAARGSTDNRKGWTISSVSIPRGDSFEEARMTWEDVQAALEKGTVIFNAAGAHIPKLAAPCLAVSDATTTPNALNLYITASGKRTSAPPHTDKQDVVVIQSRGKKYWRVYAPTDPSTKTLADIFARGKGEDNLPLYNLEESGNLLVETTLSPGDVLFVPAGFPHTTGTALEDDDDTSLHLTFNIDTHVWDLDYLSIRRLALRRACVIDSALGQSREEDNRYVGKVNELDKKIHDDLLAEIPLGFLEEESPNSASVQVVTDHLMEISKVVDQETFQAVPESVWKETVERVRQQGMELLEIHRDMYLAAMEEGQTRDAEEAMTAHLESTKRKTMSPERMQRLSLFRVQRFYEQINKCKADLVEWSYAGKPSDSGTSGNSQGLASLPGNWAFTLPVKVGDQVEADLGGAFFPASVTRVVGNRYDVQFFDGDKEEGLERSLLKLMAPPNLAEDDVDTSAMTPKQLKRWKKQQEKKNKT